MQNDAVAFINIDLIKAEGTSGESDNYVRGW